MQELNKNLSYVRTYATSSMIIVYENDLIFTTNSLAIGDTYGGGKVDYILQPEDIGYVKGEVHGIVAAPSNQGTGVVWWNGSYVLTRHRNNFRCR